MNREHGDPPLAAGVDRGRMFWTQAAAQLLMASLSPDRTQGSPAPSVTHSLELTWPTGPSAPPLPSLRHMDLPPGAGMLVFGLVHTSSPLITPQVSLKHHWLVGEPHLTPPDSTKSPKYGLSGQQGSPSQLSFYIV